MVRVSFFFLHTTDEVVSFHSVDFVTSVCSTVYFFCCPKAGGYNKRVQEEGYAIQFCVLTFSLYRFNFCILNYE